MPNHCNNHLSIMGTKKEMDRFLKLVTDPITNEIRLFKSLIPMPKELDDTTSPVNTADKGKNKELVDKYGADNWYDWCINNWDTKWGDYDMNSITPPRKNSSGNEYILDFYYDTAWSPGDEKLSEAIIKQFPKIKGLISYEEPGMAFAGELVFSNGKVISNRSWNMEESREGVDDIDFEWEEKNGRFTS